jgi:DNA invertase Pin-like site-specific DNA recombinase
MEKHSEKPLYIQYARVSTSKQEYGLEAQKYVMDNFVTSRNGMTIALFQEHESGKKNNRNELIKAIELAKEKKATLLVSKLDRLSRDVLFIFKIKEDIEFVVASNPEMGTMMLSVLAGFAQAERELISERTKAGMKVAKLKGKNIGGKRWDTTPLKLTEVTKNRHLKKREELKKFALKHQKEIKGDVNVLLLLLKYAGYKNNKGNDYKKLDLKRLGVLEVI